MNAWPILRPTRVAGSDPAGAGAPEASDDSTGGRRTVRCFNASPASSMALLLAGDLETSCRRRPADHATQIGETNHERAAPYLVNRSP